MFEGEAEVAWRFSVKEGEVLLALRVPAGGTLHGLRSGDRVRVTIDVAESKAGETTP